MAIITLNNNSLSSVTSLPAGVGGKVLQVVTATDSTQRSTTSTSFVTASNTLSLNITPSSTSNKIYLLLTTTAYNNNENKSYYVAIKRDGTTHLSANNQFINNYDASTSGAARTIGNPLCVSFLDSPSSTSQKSYQAYFKTDSSGNCIFNYNDITASLTAFEIAG